MGGCGYLTKGREREREREREKERERKRKRERETNKFCAIFILYNNFDLM
jgi:hypothetical protein